MLRPHHPVLLNEVLDALDIQKGDIVLDGTIGYAGHSELFAKKMGTSGFLIGIDQDQTAIKYCQKQFSLSDNIELYNSNFSDYKKCIQQSGFKHVNKILIDLGMSSVQLDSTTRGFSFQHEASLDMKMNQEGSLNAYDVLHHYSSKQLSDMFFNYGQLRQNKILVQHIIQSRKTALNNTTDLLNIIKKSYYFRGNRKKYIKTVSQVFQAIRIEVNQELHHLEHFLSELSSTLALDGIISILSFHSLEDKLVKHFFKANKSLFEPINKKVIKATQDEIKQNSRSHSAMLRSYKRRDRSY